jgi:transposase
MTYSTDFRKKVLSIKQQDQLTFSETSQRFGVGQATVVRWSKNIEPKRTRNKPTVKLNWEALAKDVEEHPDSYQYERAARFGVSRQGIAYALKKLNLSRKKKRSNTPKPIQQHRRSSKLK